LGNKAINLFNPDLVFSADNSYSGCSLYDAGVTFQFTGILTLNNNFGEIILNPYSHKTCMGCMNRFENPERQKCNQIAIM